MAQKPKSFSDRLREREDEEEAEALRVKEERAEKARKSKAPSGPAAAILDEVQEIRDQGSVEKLNDLLGRIEPLMEQVNQLYNQYVSGIEKRPPLERRKQLDQAMQMIGHLPKSTSALKFKCATVQSRYTTFTEQWDRKLRALEEGRKRG
jgi:hypothetical protein